MTAKIKTIAIATLLAVTVNATAFATDRGGVKVGGSLRSTTVVGKAVNIAAGPGARAGLSIGAFHDGLHSKGSVRQTIVVKKVFNMGVTGAPACLKIGSYGRNPACR